MQLWFDEFEKKIIHSQNRMEEEIIYIGFKHLYKGCYNLDTPVLPAA